ncbi:MAG: hypothetical protein K940chlam7_01739, partial [Chlamydiae bacterium]|nr:hypothetical protein [Chlamydiota bacterium]
MFTITRDHVPDQGQVLEILRKIHEQQAVPKECCREDEYKRVSFGVEELKKEIIDFSARLDMPDASEEKKKEICINKFDRKHPLKDRDVIYDHGGSLTVIPVGLIVRSLFSMKPLEEQTREWVTKVRDLREWKFKEIEEERSPSDDRTQRVLERATVSVFEARKERDAALARLKQLEDIPPRYEKRGADQESLPGLFEEEESLYAERYNGIREMTELVEKGIEYTCKDLFERSDPYPFEDIGSDTPDRRLYHINRSQEIAYGDEFESHRTAIVAYVMLRFLQGASLRSSQEEGICHGDPKVVFNDQDLFVQHSKPIRIPLDPQRPPIVVFQNPCSWALQPDHNNYPEGIDPVSAKLILDRLTDEEELHLKHLILDPFMLLEDGLRDAYVYRDREGERGSLLRTGYDLIYTMARALMQNYKTQIGHKLLEIFDDGGKKPFKRPDSLPTAAVVDEEEVDWCPDLKSLDKGIQSGIEERHKQLSIVWKNMSKELLQPAGLSGGESLNSRDFKQQVGKQYYLKHNFSNSSCRMDTLATLVFQETPEDFQKAWPIMKTIANYLDNPKNRRKFEEKIQERNLTVEELQDSYRRQGKSLIVDDFEIELAAYA